MALKLSNNGTSTLAASITNLATSLTIQGADAAKFPALAAGDWHPATITDAGGNLEIVKVTARAAAILTVVRGQEGTAARNWDTGARIDLRLTAGALAALEGGEAIHNATAKTSLAAADELPLWDSVSGAFRKITAANLQEWVRTKLGAMISASTAKTTLVDADQVGISDSTSGNASSKLSWLNLKANIWSALGGLIAGGTAKSTPVDGDGIVISDSAASSASKLVTLTQLWANYLKAKADALYQSANALLASLAGLPIVAGDLIYGSGANALARLPKDTNGKILTLVAGLPAWQNAPVSGWDMTGQTWQSVTRTRNTSYQNATGKPIMVVAAYRATAGGADPTTEISANNSTWLQIGRAAPFASSLPGAGEENITFIVPTGWYYRWTGAATSVSAVELR